MPIMNSFAGRAVEGRAVERALRGTRKLEVQDMTLLEYKGLAFLENP